MTRPIVLYVVGTRPELIRSVGVISRLRESSLIETRVIHTGQHYDWNMSAGFLEALGLGQPDYNLNCSVGTRATQVAAMLTGVASLAGELAARCVCVFGDTNSSLAAALGAETAGVPVVHLEAGARSYDVRMPEEVNRRLIDHISHLLFAVSEQCAANLMEERVPGGVLNYGDPLYEVFLRHYDPDRYRRERRAWSREAQESPYCLVTLHRQSLVDDPIRLRRHLEMIGSFATRSGLVAIFPVHPRTAQRIQAAEMAFADAFRFVDPILYDELLALLSGASLVVTDSGGLQKEAFWAKIPCVTVRENTEWTETTRLGVNRLAMDDALPGALESMLQLHVEHFDAIPNPYGDGTASAQIADYLASKYA